MKILKEFHRESKKQSLKSNYLFNLINTITQLLFPLITFSYVARIMGPEIIGKVNFYISIIAYVSMFVGLGIPLYAIREIARIRSDKQKINQVTAEIFTLHLGLSFIGYLVIFIICLTVPKVYEDIPLFLLLSLSVLFTAIGCEWFYQGIEDFKYITVRAIVVRLICVVLLFILVHSKEDIMLYACYCVVGTVGNNVFNFVRLNRYISRDFIDFRNFHPLRHLKSVSKVFLLLTISTIYISLNSIMLGFLADEKSVGYYTTGVKLFVILFSIINAMTTIMIPHASKIIAEKKEDEFRQLGQKFYRFTIGVTLPMTVGLIFISPYAVILLAGEDFIPSVIVARIVAPLLIVVGLSSLFGMQILYPLGHINIMIRAVILASIVDIVVNLLFISSMAHVAAAIAYLLAEIVATCSEYIMGYKHIPIRIVDGALCNYFVGSIVLAVVLYLVSLFNLNNIMMVIAMSLCGIIIYALYLYFRKDMLWGMVLTLVKKR